MPGDNAGHFLPAATESNSIHSNPFLRISLTQNHLRAQLRIDGVLARSIPDSGLFVVAQFAYRQRDRQPIARRRQWAGGVRGVRTGRILHVVEIEHQLARLV